MRLCRLPGTFITNDSSAAGNMICIHNVVAVLTTVGLVGKEGLLIRQNLPVCLLYGLVSGIVAGL